MAPVPPALVSLQDSRPSCPRRSGNPEGRFLSGATTPQSTAAAAAAAALRRPMVPRTRTTARDALAALDTEETSTTPDGGPAAHDTLAKRAPFALESVLPPVPQSFKCPITQEVMRDPVMTQDGQVYENESIQEWFRRGHRTSPVTGAELTNLALSPEVPLRRAIEEYMALRPEIARRELNLRSDLLTLRNVTAALEEELQAKKRILNDLSSSQHVDASGSRVDDSANTCPPSASEGHKGASLKPLRSGLCESEKGADKENFSYKTQRSAQASSGKALPPVLANLPTPCREVAGTKASKLPQQPLETSHAGTCRPSKLQEFMKAMRWPGRPSRSRPASAEPRCRGR